MNDANRGAHPMRRHLLLLASTAFLFAACSTETVIKKAPASEAPAAEEPPAVEPPPPPVTSDPLVIDLGSVTAGTDVPFEVPAGALGLHVQVEGRLQDFDPSAPFGVQRITDPSGKLVHDRFMPVGGTQPTSTAAFDTIAAASVPQSETAASIPAGSWKVRFGVFGDAGARPTLTAKVRIQSSGDGAFHGGKLNLHVHTAQGLRIGGTTINAADASKNQGINDRIDTFFFLMKDLVGIDRGEVVHHAEAASLADLDGEEILQGFAVSDGSKEGAQELHVLFVNSISQDGQPIAHGIAPGIPGAANLFGRAVSGIIVATMSTADDDALTMTHEAGHFIGLNHTTEFDGQSADPIADTPRCSTITNRDFSSCADRGNIMFPAGAIDNPVVLSNTQKRVYRGSPFYTAFLSGTQNTQSYSSSASRRVRPLQSAKPVFRFSGNPLSSLDHELSLGACGLNKIDHVGMLARHGEAQLRAAANDDDLSPILRGRARVALKHAGLAP